MSYCNITTDLTDVCPDIGELREFKRLWKEEFYLSSGQTNTYEVRNVGQINQIFDDGEQLTVKTSIADVESNAGSWYYNADPDIVYIHAKGSDDLTTATITIEKGEDWDAYLTKERNNAMEEMDAYLCKLFIVPLLPRLIKIHSSNDHESIIRMCCAYLICRNVFRRRDPGNKDADKFDELAIGFNPEEGKEKGIIAKLLDGELQLQDQITEREIGEVGRVIPYGSNLGTGYIRIVPKISKYTGVAHEVWRLEIDAAGAEGTATWKLSYDKGANWDKELQVTFDTDNNDRRIHIGSGIYVVFWGTFADGDYWDIELYPATDEATKQTFRSIEMMR